MKIVIISILIVILIGIGVWYFTTSSDSSDTTTAPTSESDVEEAVSFAINLDEYSFSPNVLQASPGEVIMVKLTNRGKTAHNFVVDELNIDSGLLSPGETKTITITAPNQSDTYAVYCGVGNHRDLGMAANLTILEQ